MRKCGATRPSDTPSHRDDISAVPAADYLVDAFDRFPLVAFSEPRHAAGGTREFLTSLIRHPRFAGTVNDIVVEFGNARYQDIADRYVAGEPVARDQLKQIWENTTVVSGVWTAPLYEGILNEIRTLNGAVPLGKRVRVVNRSGAERPHHDRSNGDVGVGDDARTVRDQFCLSAAIGSIRPARSAGISAAHAHAVTTQSRLAA